MLNAWLAIRLRRIGFQGWITLILSNLLILLSFGMTWAWCCFKVYRAAREITSKNSASDWLLIMGMKLHGHVLHVDYQQRLQSAHTYLVQNDNTRAMILGGPSGANGISEAAVGKAFLIKQGIAEHRIVCEEYSSNTHENMVQARANINSDAMTTITIISNRYHLARTRVIAGCLGIRHDLCPAESGMKYNLSSLIKIFREGYYLHWFYVAWYWSRNKFQHQTS